MVRLLQGDIFRTEAEIIAHGVNCSGSFGSGIAGQIARKWPRVRKAYLDKHQKDGWHLGEVLFEYSESKHKLPIIANIATQQQYGYDGKLYCNYDAIQTGLEKVLKFAQEGKYNYSLAIPRIGCGLAGGDWSIVRQIILDLSTKYDGVAIEVYSLEQ